MDVDMDVGVDMELTGALAVTVVWIGVCGEQSALLENESKPAISNGCFPFTICH